MKKLSIIILTLTIVTLCSAQTKVEPNVVVVKFSRDFVERELRPAVMSDQSLKSAPALKSKGIKALNRKHAVVSYRQMFRTDPRHAERHKKYDLDLFYRVRYSSEETIEEVCASFLSETEVISVEPNYINLIQKVPNDPEYGKQWGFNNATKERMDINVEKAWDITTGDSSVVVAVIDGSVDITHQDLAPNIRYNHNEIPDNGIDDDGNGYIDDYRGWNFRDNNDNVQPENTQVDSITDSHGTHVAGMVAGSSSNGKGIAGVAGGWGNTGGVKMMCFRTALADENGYYVGFGFEALVYAADNGAAIAQCSWGSGMRSSADSSAVAYFTAEGGGESMSGGLIIAAAGNDGKSMRFYPAAADGVLSVGAIDPQGKRSHFSNYGRWVKVCAPGVDIYSCIDSNRYANMSGTSMACPIVSGVAALVLSAARDIPKKYKTSMWLGNIMTTTAYMYDEETYVGPLVDAYAAVLKGQIVDSTVNSIRKELYVTPITMVYPNPASEKLTIVCADVSKALSYALYNLSGKQIYYKKTPSTEENVDLHGLPAGTYILRIETSNGNYSEKIIVMDD